MPGISDEQLNLNQDGGTDPFVLMALVGLCFLLFGSVFAVHSIMEIHNWTSTKGVVVELVAQSSGHGTTYSPRVHFKTADGKDETFLNNGGSNPPGFSSGQVVTVLYDPSSPEGAVVNEFWSLWGGVVVGAFGSLVGCGPLVVSRFMEWRKQRLRQWLVKHGLETAATFKRVEPSSSPERQSYCIVCEPADTLVGAPEFKSDDIPFNPAPFIPKGPISVFVDPSDYERYWVDTGFLADI